MGLFALPFLAKALPFVAKALPFIGGLISNKSAKKGVQAGQAQQAEANRLNQVEFEKLLREFRASEADVGRQFGELEGVGVQELLNRGREARSQSQQSLVSRGLANTSRLESERESISGTTAEAIERLKRDLAFRRISTVSGLRSERFAFQANKTISGPSSQEIAALQGQVGRGNEAIIGGAQALGSSVGSFFKRRGERRAAASNITSSIFPG